MNNSMYRESNSEVCYPLSYFRKCFEYPIELELMKRENRPSHGFHWCSIKHNLVEKGCSELCDLYNPRNTRNGCCKNYNNCYEGTGIFYIFDGNNLIQKQ